MANKGITPAGVLVRFVSAAVLVFSSYNPEGYSYYHWLWDSWMQGDISGHLPLKIFAGIILLIGWTIFIRATLRSLGPFGLFLALGFFGTLLWMVVYYQFIPANSERAITYIGLVVLCGVLTTGLSWSHIRRRITGQLDTDHVDDN